MTKDEELAELLEKVAKHLRDNARPLPDEFQKPLRDNLWDLYEVPTSRPICDACRNGGVCMCYQPEWDSPKCSVT